MPIYSAKIAGRTKPLLVEGETLGKAQAKLVDLKALTAAEMGAALKRGDKIWEPGQPLPADEVVKPDAEPGDDDSKKD